MLENLLRIDNNFQSVTQVTYQWRRVDTNNVILLCCAKNHRCQTTFPCNITFKVSLACENIRFSPRFVDVDVCETSPAAKSEEKRMFSQSKVSLDPTKSQMLLEIR